MRNLLDQIAAQPLFVVFEWIYRALKAQGYLKAFESLEHNLLVALDRTDYHSSQKISCPCCSTQTHQNGKVTYSHQALLPAIVHPEQTAVISLPPEFITPLTTAPMPISLGSRAGVGEYWAPSFPSWSLGTREPILR